MALVLVGLCACVCVRVCVYPRTNVFTWVKYQSTNVRFPLHCSRQVEFMRIRCLELGLWTFNKNWLNCRTGRSKNRVVFIVF